MDKPRTQNSLTDKACVVLDHPVLAHNLTRLRRKETSPAEFRRVLGEMSRLLAYEATRDLRTRDIAIETPLERLDRSPVIDERLIVVSIMRAGNGMLDGVIQALPFARVGHIGIYRDKHIKATVEYFFRLPEKGEGDPVLLLDPLLATGDTAEAAIARLKEYGVGRITLLSLLASRQGIERVRKTHPDVTLYTAHVERDLDEKGYLLPGIGDAGDRLYGTIENP